MALDDYSIIMEEMVDVEERKIDLMIKNIELYQEAGEQEGKPKEGIVQKLFALFQSIGQGISKMMSGSKAKELTPEQLQEPAQISKKNFGAIQKFLRMCLKVISMPIHLLVKMIQHPAKTVVAVIMGFTAVNLFKEYKETENYRKEHDIPVKKEDCLNELKTCQTICAEADRQLKRMYAAKRNEEKNRAQTKASLKDFTSGLPKDYQNLTHAQVQQQIQKLTKEKEGNPDKDRAIKLQKSIVALKKMDKMMTEKKEHDRKLVIAGKKIEATKKEFKENSSRVTELENYMNNDVTGFFNHVGKSVHQISNGFQKLLHTKSAIGKGAKVATAGVDRIIKNVNKSKSTSRPAGKSAGGA